MSRTYDPQYPRRPTHAQAIRVFPEPTTDAGEHNIWTHLGAFHGYDAALYNNTAAAALVWHDRAHADQDFGEYDEEHRHERSAP
jgi:hypothetical protein